MQAVNLSFIIATRNRLELLKITLDKLIDELLPDEEIVVVDGNSTDGTKEYLQGLFEQRKIQQFVSERDRNQAHAWNKAMLMANGVVIKKIIDDDVFCYKAIRECKNYMLQHIDVDVVISNDLGSPLYDHHNVEKYSREAHFEKWKRGLIKSFTFRDVNMLIRTSALAFIGLYNTEFVMMDWEYSLRISHSKANIVYYTGYNALTVGHLQTVTSLQDEKKVEEQGKKACMFYDYFGDRAEISLWSEVKIYFGRLLYARKSGSQNQVPKIDNIQEVYDSYYAYISKTNEEQAFKFLTI